MFASTKQDALDVASKLMHDPLIGTQGVVYREYIPLRNFGTDPICGIPYANEWRCFFYKTICLSVGYYWSIIDEPKGIGYMDKSALNLMTNVAKIASKHVTFFVMDIAETHNGEWILIELNDGQMAGLSNNNPDYLYKNLKDALGV